MRQRWRNGIVSVKNDKGAALSERDSARHANLVDCRTLNEDNESKLDDYMIFAPTPDPKQLIMYSNMSTGGQGGLPFIGSAVLVNP